MNIDPVEYNRLIDTLIKQQKEIKRLKNLLEFEEPKNFKKKHKKNITLDDPIEKWNCQHFIRYFLKLYKKAYEEDYLMPPSAWKLEAFKITHFWERHKDLTKEQFKEFITWLFATAAEDYIIKMFLITNDKQLENFKKSAAKNEKDVYNIEKEIRKATKDEPKLDISVEEVQKKLRRAVDK